MLWGELFCGSVSGSARTIQRRAELLVDFDLVAGDEFVGFVSHADDGLQLREHRVGHALFEGGGGVRRDAVVAIVGDADGDVEEFLGERIEGARAHDLFDAFPGALESGGIVGDGLPEIIDPICLACGHDVVVDSAHFRACVCVLDEAEGRHGILREDL